MIFRSPYPDIAIPETPLTPMVLRHAAQLGDKPTLIDGASGRVLTYGRLAADVRRAAGGLARRGFQKGEVLAICAPNILEYAVAFHAAASLGGIVTTINPLCTTDELTHRLRDSNAAYLLVTPDALDQARAAVAASRVRELLLFGEATEASSFASLLSDNDVVAPEVAIDAEKDLVALLYSSGKSGLPKGVMLSHHNLVAGLYQLIVAETITADDIVFGILPFFHMYGLSVLHLVLSQGATLVVMPRFELTLCLRALQDHRMTFAYLAPPVLVSLAKRPLVDEYDLSTLKVIHSGAAPLSEAVARGCAARLGCRIKQGYALTEGYPAIRVGAADPPNLKVTSVGRCVSNTECRIIDPETGAELGPGQPGELWLRGPQVMKGYLNQPAATAQTIDADGWLRTGDIGIADDDGFFTIVDRLKELIKYKGYQVAPAELEAILLAHPAIADAAVIPSPDEEAGEVPKAFVVLRGEATAAELMNFVADRVAPYKKVRRLEFIDQIPKSPSGKILRRVLVERARSAVLALVCEESTMVTVLNAGSTPSALYGHIEAARLVEVERLFRSQLSPLRLFPGSALAVYRQGRLILNLVGGYADAQRGEQVGPDTLFPLFSGTKPFATVGLWQQIERGRADLDEPVVTHWPAFGQQGKERVLIRHILSHRGGFPTTPAELPRHRWGDWEVALQAVAAMPLEHEPGTISAYHFLTQHWVCAALVCRLDGRAYADYLRAEITGPLGLSDTYVGLPSGLEHRVVRLHATDGTDEWGRTVLRGVHEAPLHRMMVPGASGVSTARDMARFYATLAAGGELDGVRLLRPETVARMLAIEVDGEIDRTFNVPVRRGLGFELGGLTDPRRRWPGSTSTARTFWHGGFGSSVCWGDADLQLAMAFMSNGVRRDEAGAVARRDLSDAVRAGFG